MPCCCKASSLPAFQQTRKARLRALRFVAINARGSAGRFRPKPLDMQRQEPYFEASEYILIKEEVWFDRSKTGWWLSIRM
jgi:hypothetical protein